MLIGKSATKSFFDDILKGNVAGHTIKHRHGHNPAVNTTIQDLWGNQDKMIYLSSAETMNIVSSDINDDLVGTGAQTVKVSGLDADFLEINETIDMDGTTPVLTTLSYIRVNDLEVMTVGTGLENAGDITATASSAGTVQAFMEDTMNHSLNGRYTTPAKKHAIFAGYEINVGMGKDVISDIKAGSGTGVLVNVHRNHIFEQVLVSQNSDVMIPPKTDLLFRVNTTSGASAGVACAFNMIEIEEEYVNNA